MNPWSIKLLQNTVKNITKKLLLPAFVFLSLPASLVEAQARPAYGESTSHGAIAPSSRRDSEPKGSVFLAQITPDGTLKTQVEIIQQLMEINGGLREGNNLFHSFEDFNIPEGMEASFQNAIDIENIFTRVTGDSISNINGILSTQGAANFFLMNPNGIVFGENASINVGGSFMATTADSINFEDGTAFAASDTSADPILTTNELSGLTFDGQPGAIQVYGDGNQIIPNFSSTPTTVEENATTLSVKSGNTLGLIGGEIATDGATINANGGRIELTSVTSGTVDLQTVDDGFDVAVNNVDGYKDITLDNLSVINSSGSGKGSIAFNAANINISSGSLVIIQNQGEIPSEAIDINATQSLNVSGVSSDGEISSYIRSETTSSGKTADINITTQELTLRNAARINSIAYADGASGNITIDASDSVRFLENTLVKPDRQAYTTSNISTGSYESGRTGSVQLTTSELEMTNGSALGSSAIGTGEGGDVTLNTDTISVSGINSLNPDRPSSSGIASSSNAGNAGDLTINTSQLQISDGARVTALTFGTGNAGEVKINASESIDIDGDSTSISSEVFPVADDAARTRAGVPLVPSGRGGNVILTTSKLNVTSGGEISVANRGAGDAGTLSVNADDFTLNDASSVTATSTSGQGGDIVINSDDFALNNESIVEATAENEGGGGNININARNITAKKDSAISANATGGDGGNVTINSDILLGIDNSDLTANAIEGDGGNITINADAIVGFEERTQLTPFSDIVASSEFGQSGTININSPESSAEEDLTVNAREIESVEAGEFLKAVCPNPFQ